MYVRTDCLYCMDKEPDALPEVETFQLCKNRLIVSDQESEPWCAQSFWGGLPTKCLVYAWCPPLHSYIIPKCDTFHFHSFHQINPHLLRCRIFYLRDKRKQSKRENTYYPLPTLILYLLQCNIYNNSVWSGLFSSESVSTCARN